MRPGPTNRWLWVRGVRAWGPVTNPTARALASWLCALWGPREGVWGGRHLPVCWASGAGRSPTSDRPSFGHEARAHYPLALGAGVGTRHQPHSARSCELALRAAGAARERLGGAPRACVWDVRGWALFHARLPVFGVCGHGPLPTGCGCGGCGRRAPSPTPQRALLRAGFARCGGGTRASGGGALCLCVRRPGPGALPPPTARPCGVRPGPTTHWLWVRGVRAWGPVTSATARALASPLCALLGWHEGARGERLLPVCGVSGVGRSPTPDCLSSGPAAGARYPLAVGAVCVRVGPAVLGTFSRPAVRRVLCALPGLAAPYGRCFFAPVLALWLWPAACFSGVPRGPALVGRASSGPVPLGAPVAFPVAVVPSPTKGAVAPGFTGWLLRAGGEPGSLCLRLAPAEARALGTLRVVPVRIPAMGLSLAGPSGFGLGLRALRWFCVCGPGH